VPEPVLSVTGISCGCPHDFCTTSRVLHHRRRFPKSAAGSAKSRQQRDAFEPAAIVCSHRLTIQSIVSHICRALRHLDVWFRPHTGKESLMPQSCTHHHEKSRPIKRKIQPNISHSRLRNALTQMAEFFLRI